MLHGLSNLCQDRVSGEVPEVMYVIATALLFTYGAILVRGAQQPLAGARGQ